MHVTFLQNHKLFSSKKTDVCSIRKNIMFDECYKTQFSQLVNKGKKKNCQWANRKKKPKLVKGKIRKANSIIPSQKLQITNINNWILWIDEKNENTAFFIIIIWQNLWEVFKILWLNSSFSATFFCRFLFIYSLFFDEICIFPWLSDENLFYRNSLIIVFFFVILWWNLWNFFTILWWYLHFFLNPLRKLWFFFCKRSMKLIILATICQNSHFFNDRLLYL